MARENAPHIAAEEAWPELPWEEWRESCATLHRWLQVIGKVRLQLAPMVNHWWQVPLYVTPRGLTTSAIPYGPAALQIDFDFHAHRLQFVTDNGAVRELQLVARPVADFYEETMAVLKSLGMEVEIWTTPVEMDDRTPFELDNRHSAYDPHHVHRFMRALLQVDRVMKRFRAGFIGKASPVHFFWGAFDHAVTRFSGRRAPEHPGAPNVARSVMVEAYSHEVSSCGFWPGAGLGMPAFYSYAYPEPPGFKEYTIQPAEAYYDESLREFILPYDAVRTARSPEQKLLLFLQRTYEAAADLGNWDRTSLERGEQEAVGPRRVAGSEALQP